MLATAKSPNKEDMWGAYLQPFSLKRRASKHFSRRWKASSRSSCHISSFERRSGAPYPGEGYVFGISSSSLSVTHSHSCTPAHPSPPQPAPARRSSHPLPVHLPLTTPPYTLQFSLCLPQDVSRLAPSFQSLHYCPFSPITFSKPQMKCCARLAVCAADLCPCSV